MELRYCKLCEMETKHVEVVERESVFVCGQCQFESKDNPRI